MQKRGQDGGDRGRLQRDPHVRSMGHPQNSGGLSGRIRILRQSLGFYFQVEVITGDLIYINLQALHDMYCKPWAHSPRHSDSYGTGENQRVPT